MRAVHTLQPAEFAFLRAVFQGIDVDVAWERFLSPDDSAWTSGHRPAGLPVFLRCRERAARLARRLGRSQLARDLQGSPAAALQAGAPDDDFEAFRLSADLDGFSEAEQLEFFRARRGSDQTSPAPRRVERWRARVIEGLWWLERQPALLPTSGDLIRRWWTGALVRSCESRQLWTWGDLLDWRSERGPHWYRHLAGIGPVRGHRVEQWLIEVGLVSPGSASMQFSPARAVSGGPGVAGARSVGVSGQVRPLEHYRAPAALKDAEEDVRLVRAWLRARGLLAVGGDDPSEVTVHGSHPDVCCGPDALSPATLRSYRKEIERLLLWSHLVRGKRLIELSVEDASAYLEFLRRPAPARAWCGPRFGARTSQVWRPFEGPLSLGARRLAHAVLRAFFQSLLQAGGSGSNPWSRVVVLDDAGRRTDPDGLAHVAARRGSWGGRALIASAAGALDPAMETGTPRDRPARGPLPSMLQLRRQLVTQARITLGWPRRVCERWRWGEALTWRDTHPEEALAQSINQLELAWMHRRGGERVDSSERVLGRLPQPATFRRRALENQVSG